GRTGPVSQSETPPGSGLWGPGVASATFRSTRRGPGGGVVVSAEDLPERARLHRALQAELPGLQPAVGDPVADRLLASWQRSQDYGVSLENVEPVFAGTGDGGGRV